MKKVIIASAMLLGTVLGVNAQANFGITGGLNISSLRGDAVSNSDVTSLFGGNLGFAAAIPAGTNFFVQPEVKFSQEGAKSQNFDSKLFLNYVNVPLMLKYKGNSGLFGEVGPQVGFLISAKNKTPNVSIDVKDSYKSTNFSAVGGLGYFLDENVSVGLRYALGLSNILENNNSDVKSSTFSVNLHYFF